MTRRYSTGFTLIEVLLSLALLAGIIGIGTPVYQNIQNRNALALASVVTAETARRAQVLAQGSVGDQSWGVHLTSGVITLFQGAGYATRDTSFDEVFEIAPSITISGAQEYLFLKSTGRVQTVGTTTLTSVEGVSKDIAINELGTITY